MGEAGRGGLPARSLTRPCTPTPTHHPRCHPWAHCQHVVDHLVSCGRALTPATRALLSPPLTAPPRPPLPPPPPRRLEFFVWAVALFFILGRTVHKFRAGLVRLPACLRAALRCVRAPRPAPPRTLSAAPPARRRWGCWRWPR